MIIESGLVTIHTLHRFSTITIMRLGDMKLSKMKKWEARKAERIDLTKLDVLG